MFFYKRITATLAALAMLIVFAGWGYTGHKTINTKASLSFNEEMSDFYQWTTILANHASDADYRKNVDPTEGPKHYIDIDNYQIFNTTGRIPQTYDSVVSMYGLNFVIDNGILPWATLTTYDSLQACFTRGDWDKAVLFAADLGHYVADGHMPLHLTKNYNGQFTGNYGIHSRYETTMINAFISHFVYEGREIAEVENVSDYVFGYIYDKYIYVDSVLAADNYAQEVAGNTNSWTYKSTLWEQSKSFTVPLFSDASHALAELIYSAWKAAGSPPMPSSSICETNGSDRFSLQNRPNPFSGETEIGFKLEQHAGVTLSIFDLQGNRIQTICSRSFAAGTHHILWQSANLPSGVYYLLLETGEQSSVKKIVSLGD
ncbi:MAG: T9SS type A sorting domain-containing protein [Bacteroidota bacterium]